MAKKGNRNREHQHQPPAPSSSSSTKRQQDVVTLKHGSCRTAKRTKTTTAASTTIPLRHHRPSSSALQSLQAQTPRVSISSSNNVSGITVKLPTTQRSTAAAVTTEALDHHHTCYQQRYPFPRPPPPSSSLSLATASRSTSKMGTQKKNRHHQQQWADDARHKKMKVEEEPEDSVAAAEMKRRQVRKARFNLDNNSTRHGPPSSAGGKSAKTTTTTIISTESSGEPSQLTTATDVVVDVDVAVAGPGANDNEGDETVVFVGECMDLEKPYLRLTTFPRKESVRPMPVLQRALVHIQQRYLQTEDFDWCNEQLKSLRQDLTVQSSCWRRRSNQSHSYDTHSNSNKYDRFVLNVYETHARILLEHGDLAEFNQCQTNLAQLTNGNNNPGYGFQQSEESTAEFRAYAILYSLVREAPTDLILHLQHSFPSARKNNNREKPGKASTKRRRSHVIGSATAIATPAVAISACVDHAWQVVRAVTTNSYRTFFRLYDSAPHLSAYLMDFLVQRVRQAAYDCIVAAYRPSVSVEFVRQHLQLADGEETRHFLQQRRAVFLEQPPSSSDHHQHQKQEHEPPLLLFWIDCKASQKLLQS